MSILALVLKAMCVFQCITAAVTPAGATSSISRLWMRARASAPGSLCSVTWATKTLSLWVDCRRRRRWGCTTSFCTSVRLQTFGCSGFVLFCSCMWWKCITACDCFHRGLCVWPVWGKKHTHTHTVNVTSVHMHQVPRWPSEF